MVAAQRCTPPRCSTQIANGPLRAGRDRIGEQHPLRLLGEQVAASVRSTVSRSSTVRIPAWRKADSAPHGAGAHAVPAGASGRPTRAMSTGAPGPILCPTCAFSSSARGLASTPCSARCDATPAVGELHIAPGNAGTAALATAHPVDVADPGSIADLAELVRPDLVVIGPEVPLVNGAADELRARGYRGVRSECGRRPNRGLQGLRQGRDGRGRRADRRRRQRDRCARTSRPR